MKKILIAFCLTIFSLTPALILAKEPTNLATVKKELIRYHDSGQYEKEMNAVLTQAASYLHKRLGSLSKLTKEGKKPAIILDIDETSLSNYSGLVNLDFGGSFTQIKEEEDKGIDPVIPATLKLYDLAKTNQIAVFFLTGRAEDERNITAENLKKAGYRNWDGLILRSEEQQNLPAATYKTAVRKQLTEQGYHILINIGDQKSDLVGGYADKTFKLPNPYYFIP